MSEQGDQSTPDFEGFRLVVPVEADLSAVEGAMDDMLQKIADFYEEEVDAAVAAMSAMLEPIILVFLGVGVGGMLIAMYLPIFDVAGGIK